MSKKWSTFYCMICVYQVSVDEVAFLFPALFVPKHFSIFVNFNYNSRCISDFFGLVGL